MSVLGKTKGDGAVGPQRQRIDGPRVAVEAGGAIDGDHVQRFARRCTRHRLCCGPQQIGQQPLNRPVGARAQQRIDQHPARRQPLAQRHQAAVIARLRRRHAQRQQPGKVSFVVVRRIRAPRPEVGAHRHAGRVQTARTDQPVAAIVAGAAEHQHRLAAIACADVRSHRFAGAFHHRRVGMAGGVSCFFNCLHLGDGDQSRGRWDGWLHRDHMGQANCPARLSNVWTGKSTKPCRQGKPRADNGARRQAPDISGGWGAMSISCSRPTRAKFWLSAIMPGISSTTGTTRVKLRAMSSTWKSNMSNV